MDKQIRTSILLQINGLIYMMELKQSVNVHVAVIWPIVIENETTDKALASDLIIIEGDI